jgi:hypothetical protein
MANTQETMRRGLLLVATLVLGSAGGALLGGCGGSGTKTVSVSDSAPPASTSTATSTAAKGTPQTDTSPTRTTAKSPASTAPENQSSSATRTSPEPAFAQHTSGASESPSQSTPAAAAVVRAHGYTPNAMSDFHPEQTLGVVVATKTGSGDGYNQQAFFFVNGKYIGTDTAQPSASVKIVSQSDTEVTLAYPLYRAHDPLCCPGGGQATVHFQLNDGKLTPVGQIPPASSASGLSRQ